LAKLNVNAWRWVLAVRWIAVEIMHGCILHVSESLDRRHIPDHLSRVTSAIGSRGRSPHHVTRPAREDARPTT
jgi:hypothetical protein